jgi:hypothetical protein
MMGKLLRAPRAFNNQWNGPYKRYIMTQLDDLNNRAMEVAHEAVTRGLWCAETAQEFLRLHHGDEDLRFWEEALLNLVNGPPQPCSE